MTGQRIPLRPARTRLRRVPAEEAPLSGRPSPASPDAASGASGASDSSGPPAPPDPASGPLGRRGPSGRRGRRVLWAAGTAAAVSALVVPLVSAGPFATAEQRDDSRLQRQFAEAAERYDVP